MVGPDEADLVESDDSDKVRTGDGGEWHTIHAAVVCRRYTPTAALDVRLGPPALQEPACCHCMHTHQQGFGGACSRHPMLAGVDASSEPRWLACRWATLDWQGNVMTLFKTCRWN
jgi:hypothetical protein